MLGLKSFLIFLGRNKKYTLINLFGLSVSLMFVLLMANYVVDEFTIDRGVKKSDRIFLVGNEKILCTGYWIGQKLHDRYPEVENHCAVTPLNFEVNIRDVKYNAQFLCVDTSFFSMFSVDLIEGNPKNALLSPNDVVVSQSFARKAFGNINPIGKKISFLGENNKERTVIGIVKNFDNSIFPNFDILLNSTVTEDYISSFLSEDMRVASSAHVFLLTKEGTQEQLMAKSDDMSKYFKEFFWVYKKNLLRDVKLIPFKDVHYSTIESPMLRKGERTLLMVLTSVCIFILLFSVVNYINLTTAQTGFRAKEMATRRLLGSSRASLFARLIVESFVMCTMAFGIAILLASAAEPYANSLLHSKIDIFGNFSWNYLLFYFGSIVLLSVISGVVPAIVISNFKPIEVVRGSLRRKTSMVYSKFLIAFQNIITIALIGGSITMLWQVRHLTNAPLGYTYENIIDIDSMQGFRNYAQIKEAVTKLNHLPCVKEIGQGMGTPFKGCLSFTEFGSSKMINICFLRGDSSYFKILGLRIKKDNHSTASETYYLSEYAFKALEISEDSPVVKFGPNLEYEWNVGGVYHDFKTGSVLMEQYPCFIRDLKNFDDYNDPNKEVAERYSPWDILIKVDGDPKKAFDEVKKVVMDVTESPEFYGSYIADQLKESYAEQRRVSTIMLIFTGIAVLISMLGLLAMSTYYIQQRKKEVAVRKIFGSTSQQVLGLLTSSFMKIVGIAFVIAVPIIWYAMDWWLSDFAYRIALSPLIFLGAGIFASIFAFITVYWQSRIAANANPVDSIK